MKLIVNNLAFAYNEQSPLWQNVSFTLNKGEIMTILGSNGIGKTTLLRTLIGFYKPLAGGDVRLITDEGDEYTPYENQKEFTEQIGYVPQVQNTAYSFLVRDYVVMGRAPHLGVFTNGGHGDYGEYLDISQRFGKDRNIGVRIYGQYDDGGLAISGAGQRKKNLFANISYEGETTKTNVFGGYYDQKLLGTERRFALDASATKFPNAPDASKSFDDPKVMHQDTNGYMLTLNHQKKLSENVNWFVNAGMNQSVVRRFIYNSEFTIDENGNVIGDGAFPWSDHIYIQNQYLQTGLKGDFMTGMAKHNVAVSVDRSHRKYYKNAVNRKTLGTTGNIYTGLIFNPGIYGADVSDKIEKKLNHEETDVTLNIMDKIELGKLTLVGAVARRHGNFIGKKSQVKDDNWAPTYGISYAPTDKLSVYAAQAVAKNRGSFVEDDNTGNVLNANTYLDSQRLKNTEFGIKAKPNENLSMSIAYFDMT